MKTYLLSFMFAKSEVHLWAQVGVLKAWLGNELDPMADRLRGN